MRAIHFIGPASGVVLSLSGCPNQDGMSVVTDAVSTTEGATGAATAAVPTGSSAPMSSDSTATEPQGTSAEDPHTTGQDSQATVDVTSTTTGGGCSERPAGGYGDCIHGEACDGQSPICISDDPRDPSFGVCSLSCDDDCDCFAGPKGATAVSACAPVLAGGETACVLDCSGGKTCPPGMDCLGGLDVCVFMAEPDGATDSSGTTDATGTNDVTGTTGMVRGCGDGQVDDGETCDDGNAANNDACLSTCEPAYCGDGFVWAGVEDCDDGNAVETDACLSGCIAAKCGDTFVWSGVEACDDGNVVGDDGCEGDCSVTPGSKVWLKEYDAVGGYMNHATVDTKGDLFVVLGHADNYGAIYRIDNVSGDAAFVTSLPYFAQKIAVAKNGDLLVVGWNSDMDGTIDDPTFIERRSPTGELIWNRQYMGVKGGAWGYGITETKAGAVIAVGTMVTVTYQDAWIQKYTADGVLMWTQTNNGDGNSREMALAVTSDAQDNVITVGVENGNSIWLGKYSPAGAELWSKRFDSVESSNNEAANAVVVRPDGDIVVAGQVSKDGSEIMWVATYSPAGALEWAKTYSTPFGAVYGVVADPMNNIVYTGREQIHDITVRKLDPLGSSIWVRHDDITAPSPTGGRGIGLDPEGFVLVAGRISGNAENMWAGKFYP